MDDWVLARRNVQVVVVRYVGGAERIAESVKDDKKLLGL